ncbi:hypothetical protein KHA80_09135 [Anaerobacillus sp. HL2]|nr:hypothetical protein KHA80_09135 [Anaerobacillus sp. HL2]
MAILGKLLIESGNISFKQTIRKNLHNNSCFLKNENEAIVFKLDPLRVFAWLYVNNLIEVENSPKNKEEAYALLYTKLKLAHMDVSIITNTDLKKIEDDNSLLASVLTFS